MLLRRLGLAPRPLVIGLGKAQELLELVGSFPPIRRSWFDGDRRQTIRNFLHTTQVDLPEFSEVALAGLVADPEALARVTAIATINSSGKLFDGVATVVQLRDKLEFVANSLQTLRQCHLETQSAMTGVLAALGLTPRPIVIRGLGKVQEILELVGKISPIRRTWFDVERRREIVTILERHREDEERSTQCRLRLLERMQPIAFDSRYASLVMKCRSYRPIWRRLLPDWWIQRRRLAPLYTKEIPDATVLMDDLRELADYHRRHEFGRQLKREYAEHLVLREDGELDREGTLFGLRASERFDPLIRAFPELKEVLVDQSRVDRDAFRTNLDGLTLSYRKFREALAHASKHFEFGMVFNPDGILSRMSVEEFAKWLEVQTFGVLERLADVDRLCLLLKTGRDVSLGDLQIRLASISALRLVDFGQPADHLAIKGDGELDRELTMVGLRATEQLDPLIGAFPELKGILVDPSPIDRDGFRTSLERCASSQRGFRNAVADASKHRDVGNVLNSDGFLVNMSMDELTKWVDGQASGVREYLAGLTRLCQSLKPGCDVNLVDLPGRLVSIAELGQADVREPADHFVLQACGELDRELTINGLLASEQFDPLVRVLPELKETLVNQSQVDQAALKFSLEELGQRYRSFREALTTVEKQIDLSDVLGSGARQSTISLTGLAQFIERELNRFEARLEHLSAVSALLKPTHDVSLSELPARLRLLEALCKSAFKISRLATKLGLESESAAIWDRDWRDVRSTAEWTIGFLERYADRPPEPLVRAATNPEIRRDLIDAVRRNLAARTGEFTESWEFLTQLFEPDQDVSTGIQIEKASVSALHDWIEQRRVDAHLIQEWLRFCELREQIVQADLDPILSKLLNGKLAIEDAKNSYLVRCYRSWLDWVYERNPALERFTSDEHERLIGNFRRLDRDAIQRSFTTIREALLGDPARPNASALDAPSASELGTLLREVNKRKRHLPLRQLFAKIPTALLRLKPCLMMSPLAVSTYLDTKHIRFDLVIFDEASQVRPYDAISTIYRGRQLVVAGDQKQLPPTTFFERTMSDDELASDEGENEETLADFESILDVCCTLGLPRRRLRWHYRSRREQLIAFSNLHFYDNELVTFPSVLDTGQMPALHFEYVSEGRWKSGSSGGFNTLEARRTAELVMAHFRASPELTLGVIAFSQRQQMAILDELERLRRMDPSLEDCFSDAHEEPFFVKNLENVQGDERDVIFLSIGYGPDENGRVSMRFGPLNRKGGERRLNVAITRSRSEMTVISSMRSHDIDLSRTTAVGAKLLRAYIDFAERGVSALGSEVTQADEEECESPFEQEVAEALKQRGLEVRKQIGCSKYKIDLALVHPNYPGRFILGIECDGATYHNSATARDRDRLRQEVLESCGWRIVRIWSTDWVRDPASQINRVVAAFERSLAEANKNPGPAKPNSRAKRPKDVDPVSTKQSGPSTSNKRLVDYPTIDDVPSSEIERLILSALEKYGVTGESALLVPVARQLGFQRTGAKIKTRIAECVADLVTESKIVRMDGDRLRLNSDSGSKLG